MRRVLRKGVGELVGLALLAIIIMYALIIMYVNLYLSLRNEIERATKIEIPAAEERLLILLRNNTALAISQWKGKTTVVGLECGYGTRNPTVTKLSKPIAIPPWRATTIDLPPRCKPTVCLVTTYYNIICNATIPTKTITLKSAVILPNASRVLAFPQEATIPIWLEEEVGSLSAIYPPNSSVVRTSSPALIDLWIGWVAIPALVVALDPGRTWVSMNWSVSHADIVLRFWWNWELYVEGWVNGSLAMVCAR